MAGNKIERIGGVRGISYNSGRVSPVTRYTPEERAEKLAAIYKESQERQEIAAYLKQFPNPEDLSFEELIAKEVESQQDPDFIVDIGKHG